MALMTGEPGSTSCMKSLRESESYTSTISSDELGLENGQGQAAPVGRGTAVKWDWFMKNQEQINCYGN